MILIEKNICNKQFELCRHVIIMDIWKCKPNRENYGWVKVNLDFSHWQPYSASYSLPVHSTFMSLQVLLCLVTRGEFCGCREWNVLVCVCQWLAKVSGQQGVNLSSVHKQVGLWQNGNLSEIIEQRIRETNWTSLSGLATESIKIIIKRENKCVIQSGCCHSIYSGLLAINGVFAHTNRIKISHFDVIV